MSKRVSICIANYDRPDVLDRVLASIYRQTLKDVEVVVVDDGSPDAKAVVEVVKHWHVPKFVRIEREPFYRNPSIARNTAYRCAEGDVIIAQSDDVEHQGNAIEGLLGEMQPGKFVIGEVWNVCPKTGCTVPAYKGRWHQLTGPGPPTKQCPNPERPLFFLGALYRKDLYAVGGNDEEFLTPGAEDRWFGDCLMRGQGLKPHYTNNAVGHHLDHTRPTNLGRIVAPSLVLCKYKYKEAERTGVWCSMGGPWPYTHGVSISEMKRRKRLLREKMERERKSCE